MDAPRAFFVARRRTVRPLVELMPMYDAILRAATDRVVVAHGRETLEDVLRGGRRFVFAINHGPPHMLLVPPAALVRVLVDSGGGGLHTVGIAFRPLYFIPVVRRWIHRLTQLEASPSFDELLEGFRAGAWDGVAVMPEGANSAFGVPPEVHPFVSPRFVELATRVDAPLVLVLHHGLEHHARDVTIPRALRESAWLEQHAPYGLGRALARTGAMTRPTSFARVPELRLAIDVHRPSISSSDFEAMELASRRVWLEREAAIVHAKMVDLHRGLRPDSGLPVSGVQP